MAKITVDEKLVLKIYEMAKESGNLENEIDPVKAALQIGERGKKINVIVRLLCNSSFLKKRGDNAVALTPKGIKLAEDLKS